jgi:hypothetical protein
MNEPITGRGGLPSVPDPAEPLIPVLTGVRKIAAHHQISRRMIATPASAA